MITLLLILTFSLTFGQVLGNLYLENLDSHSGSTIPTPVTKGKVNVLRLNVIKYYTVEVASYEEREKAVKVGNILAEQGIPVVITGTAPYRVQLGFLNQAEKLSPLAQAITVDGQKARIIEKEINSLAYKFPEENVLARERIAPFLGQVSLALEKAVLLNGEIDCTLSHFVLIKPKFLELAEYIVILTAEGQEIVGLLQEGDPQQVDYFISLVEALSKWASSVKELETEWNDRQLLISHQHTLAVIEEYQSFIKLTN